MKFQYLGTAAAEGFPAVFCNCESCRQARKNLQYEWRSRSQAIINDELLIDFPPESYLHAMRFGLDLSAVKILLVTHSHSDHFYAQEFLNRGYKFAYNLNSDSLELYADSDVLQVYREGIRRERRDCVDRNIFLHETTPFTHFTCGKYEVWTLSATHTQSERALLYCIRGDKTILYLHDTGLLAEQNYEYLQKQGIRADFISFDCTFGATEGPHSMRHMGFREDCIVRERLEKIGVVHSGTKCCVSHFSHNSEPFRDAMEQKAKEYGFLSAHDGMIVEI